MTDSCLPPLKQNHIFGGRGGRQPEQPMSWDGAAGSGFGWEAARKVLQEDVSAGDS